MTYIHIIENLLIVYKKLIFSYLGDEAINFFIVIMQKLFLETGKYCTVAKIFADANFFDQNAMFFAKVLHIKLTY